MSALKYTCWFVCIYISVDTVIEMVGLLVLFMIRAHISASAAFECQPRHKVLLNEI